MGHRHIWSIVNDTQTSFRTQPANDHSFPDYLAGASTWLTPFINGLNLTKAKLPGANLADANLREANLTEADFTRACLRNADLAKVTPQQTIMHFADLQGANLTDVWLLGFQFMANNLENAILKDVFDGGDLRQLNLKGANLENAALEHGVLLAYSNLQGTQCH